MLQIPSVLQKSMRSSEVTEATGAWAHGRSETHTLDLGSSQLRIHWYLTTHGFSSKSTTLGVVVTVAGAETEVRMRCATVYAHGYYLTDV